MSEQPKTPDALAIRRDTTTMRERIEAFEITSDVLYEAAGEELKDLRRLNKRIDAAFDPPIAQANKTHKMMLEAKREHERPVTECEHLLKGKMTARQDKQERLRMAEEERLRKIALKAEKERIAAQAEQLADEGNTEQAVNLLDQPIEAPPVVLAKTTPKVEGVSIRKIWKARPAGGHAVYDISLLPLEYHLPNEQALGALARSLGAQAKVAGVEFYCEDSVAVTA